MTASIEVTGSDAPASASQDTEKPGLSKREAARRAEARITGPVSGRLRRAGVLSVLSSALWPVQAALIAWAVAGWADGRDALWRSVLAAAIFLFAALIRALLDRQAGAILFDAADEVIARERARILEREPLAPGPDGSASVAALAVQKLPMLHPWITRYRVAMLRVMVIPLLLLVISASFSWAVGLILLMAGPLIPVFMALVGMAAEDASRRQLGEIGTMNAMLMDRLGALLDIRLLGAGDRAADAFGARADSLRVRTMAVLRIAFLSSTVLELFAAIGVAMVAVYVGFTLLGQIHFGLWDGNLTLEEGLFLLLLAPEFFQPLRDLAAAWHDRASGLAVASELVEADQVPRAAVLGHGGPETALPGRMALAMQNGRVRLGDRLIALPDFSLRPGEALALMGPSGVGKSTTLMAIAGLVPLAEGRLLVSETDLTGANADAWRARLTVMPQAPHFADRSLRDFLDPTGCNPDLDAALAMARASDVVARLPEGLNTRLGESGGGVSGGEARRLMLARAIASGRELILADEPTADLDGETAAAVIATLRDMQASGRSLIVATHDPALAAAMDRTVKMEG